MEAKVIQLYSKKSIPNLLKVAVKVFNAFIRTRDSDDQGNFTCISCNKPKPKEQLQAGHYFPAGQYGHLKFNENNVHGECIFCNYYSGDHLIKYRVNLINKLGLEEVEKLEAQAKVSGFKWDRFELIDIIQRYQ
jgi:5-methylcytosine-specific restriction endonuclease McrA